jgi:hypothetical protein
MLVLLVNALQTKDNGVDQGGTDRGGREMPRSRSEQPISGLGRGRERHPG